MKKAAITAIEHYLPRVRISNDSFAKRFSISSHDIYEKTGIKSRFYIKNGATSDLILPAIKTLLEVNKLKIDEIDCLIVATVTPDYQFPSTAAVVLNKLQAKNTFGFDIAAACSGFIYAISIAKAFIETGIYKRIIVCGADKMSSTLNANDYRTSILFGDGAGVVMIEEAPVNAGVIHESICRMDVSGLYDVYIPYGGSANETDNKLDTGKYKIKMDGKAVFEKGVTAMVEIISSFLAKKNMDVDYFIPHQANKRMLMKVAERLKIDSSKMLMNIEWTGNTSAASIPICISEFAKNGTIKKGDKLLLCGFGSGYAYGLTYLTW